MEETTAEEFNFNGIVFEEVEHHFRDVPFAHFRLGHDFYFRNLTGKRQEVVVGPATKMSNTFGHFVTDEILGPYYIEAGERGCIHTSVNYGHRDAGR